MPVVVYGFVLFFGAEVGVSWIGLHKRQDSKTNPCRSSFNRHVDKARYFYDRSWSFPRTVTVNLFPTCGSCLLYDSNSLLSLSRHIMSLPPHFRQIWRLSSLSKARPRILLSIRARAFADRPKFPRPDEPPRGVWAPKTRIAVGIVFIGAMIYSMVPSLTRKTSNLIETHPGYG